MLSEKFIAKYDDNFWNECAPILTNQNKSNLKFIISKYATKKQFANFFIAKSSTYFNDLVSEIAFTHCANYYKNQLDKKICIIEDSIQRINLISGKKLETKQLTIKEIKDALKLSKRIRTFLTYINASNCKFHPKLRGYGYLNTCHPDLITNKIIIEIKSSNYGFRLEDFRQIFLYYFLSLQNNIIINKLALVNPRFGNALFFNAVNFFELMSQTSSTTTLKKISKILVSN